MKLIMQLGAAILGAATLTLGLGTAHAQTVIDFENVPGGSSDDLNLDGIQFNIGGNQFVTFSTLNPEGIAFLEATGTDTGTNGFVNDQTSGTQCVTFNSFECDVPNTGDLGNYFLRTGGLSFGGDNGQATPATQLFINFNNSLGTKISGELWDIDGTNSGTEQWLVEALADDGTTVLASKTSPIGTTNQADSLDGAPWLWSFDQNDTNGQGISKVRISFQGSKTTGVGVAFDNFIVEGSQAVPEPTAVLGLAAIAGLAVGSRRKHKADQAAS